MLRLHRWVEKTGDREISAAGGGLAILVLGQATMVLHSLARTPALPPEAARAARQALERISAVERDPAAAAAALTRTADALANTHANEGRLLRDAAAAVASHLTFFRRDIGKTS